MDVEEPTIIKGKESLKLYKASSLVDAGHSVGNWPNISLASYSSFSLAALAYGAIHLIAWDGSLAPTIGQGFLWPQLLLSLASSGPLLVTTWKIWLYRSRGSTFLRSVNRVRTAIALGGIAPLLALYSFPRLYLLVESILNLSCPEPGTRITYRSLNSSVSVKDQLKALTTVHLYALITRMWPKFGVKTALLLKQMLMMFTHHHVSRNITSPAELRGLGKGSNGASVDNAKLKAGTNLQDKGVGFFFDGTRFIQISAFHNVPIPSRMDYLRRKVERLFRAPIDWAPFAQPRSECTPGHSRISWTVSSHFYQLDTDDQCSLFP
jgi:hypothetical protein